MDDELRSPTARDLASFGEGRTCRYCGAALTSAYYFCLACATPYKEPASVLAPIRPLRPTTGALVRRHAPKVATLWWTYLIVIVGSAVLLQLLAGGARLGVHMIVMDVVLLVTTVYFAITYWTSLKQQFKRVGFGHPAAWIGLGLLVPLLVLNYGYHAWLGSMAGVEEGSWIQQLREDGFSQAALVLSIAVFPALSEEIAFRGLLQHWLQVALRPARAIGIAAALFAAMHLSILSFPILFLAGALLGWVKWKTGSLYPSMLLHFLHNLAVVMLFEA